MIIRFFRTPAFSQSAEERILKEAAGRLNRAFGSLLTEFCFYVEVSDQLSSGELSVLSWLLAETFEPENFGHASFLNGCETVLEVGPRLTFETPYSSSAVAICHKCGLTKIQRLERSVRYGLSGKLTRAEGDLFLSPLHDRMTQERYLVPRDDFTVRAIPEPVRVIPLIEEGIAALKRANLELGLAMDDQDLGIWYELFVGTLQRNPTDVELFQIGQANSEHSRHGWFKGKHIIDGHEVAESPMDIVRATWLANPKGSVIAFADNSSAIAGYAVDHLCASNSIGRNIYRVDHGVLLHPTLTAETHNHPSGVEPFEGAGTGGGGRIRDNQMVGRGGFPIAGGAGYCTANLRIPGYDMPWEKDSWQHPNNLASPLEIMIRASDGASYYGNCFGEPLILGFARTFEMQVAEERRAWFKPIMYSVGAGAVRDEHVRKSVPEKGMFIVLLGGPGFRIGVGGGSASSMIAGANVAELDFASVQRSNPEMENRVDRVVRACINLGADNPIESAHDLGAGGTCNALPEIADPAGARIDLTAIPVADASLSVRETWGNESQERNVVLIRAERLPELQEICKRESCPVSVVGKITGDGQLILHDQSDGSEPVHLPLERILGKLPQKTFAHNSVQPSLKPLALPQGLSVRQALERVLRLLSVASKRWLTNKVDRNVMGLIAQQQCVGPNHTPVADFAIRADSYFGLSGEVVSLGEQPIKGLLSPAAMGRLAVSEALLNMSGAVIDNPTRIKCSGNWMWAAKLPGEGPKLIDAAVAARDIMIELGLAIDGGKDSLSMAAKAESPEGRQEIVKAPGEFVVAAYAFTSDITRKATPDLKHSGNMLLWIDLGFGKSRLGGSALAQVFSQIGDESPDVDNVQALSATFRAVQHLVRDGLVASVHDVSDGGLIVTLLEMAFAGNFGFEVSIESDRGALSVLFAEEPGVVIELSQDRSALVMERLQGLPVREIGQVGDRGGRVLVMHNGLAVLDEEMVALRSIWEETSQRLELLQANPECISEQGRAIQAVSSPPYHLTYKPQQAAGLSGGKQPRVALIREEGTNGDREMAASMILGGFEVWDITMQDLVKGEANLDKFRGVVFPGGFAFADVLDSAKGWAGVIRFNERVAEQFERFRSRPDTFSLGVCNGCQLMALLGWIPGNGLVEVQQPRFIRNRSERFESRFPTVRIEESPAIMLKGMAGSILGVWVAHGEGRFHAQEQVRKQILAMRLAPIRYVDNKGEFADRYPFNPNGSPDAIAAVCSVDGRHLAMMPHPERTSILWQWPWTPEEWRGLEASPWLRMFQNAHEWCKG